MSNCTIAQRILPKNDANTCWWLSANLALFHKRRTDIDNSYTSAPKTEFAPVSSNIESIYFFYSGILDGRPIPTASNIIDLRLGSNMATLFNTDKFKVDGSGTQSSDEYITKLTGFIGLDKGLVSINPGESTGALETSAYDLYLHATHFGIPNEGNTQSNRSYSQISSSVNTLILTCGRSSTSGKTSIPIQVLEAITIPTVNIERLLQNSNDVAEFAATLSNVTVDSNINLLQYPCKLNTIAQYTDSREFYLDAMVVYEPGHYVAYVKCDTDESWFYYKAIHEGTLLDSNTGNRTFKDFNDMMSNDGEKISKNFTHLVYSLNHHGIVTGP